MDRKLQYGSEIRAAIINYSMVQMMSLEKVEEHFRGLIGRVISQATILKYLFQFYLRLKKHESSVLMFARVKEVNFTNNRAERDIRCSKTKQKILGGFRTLKFAKAYARIISYVKTMRYRGYSSF